MQDSWLDNCLQLARRRADFYSGARKIIRGHSIVFRDWGDDLTMADCGFTKSKMSMLTRNYLHEESRKVALQLWRKRLEQDKYGSVSFTCFAHFIKGNVSGASPRGSVFGPCIQSVALTYLPRGEVSVDVFYRTTEFFKKFPADLVFIRDVLLPPFKIKPKEVRFHFANITMHPMYFVTIVPLLDNPIRDLQDIKKQDKFFHDWCVKWTARYLVPEYERGIQKFSQALRVQADARQRIDRATIRDLSAYLKKNHPGFRGEANVNDGEED